MDGFVLEKTADLQWHVSTVLHLRDDHKPQTVRIILRMRPEQRPERVSPRKPGLFIRSSAPYHFLLSRGCRIITTVSCGSAFLPCLLGSKYIVSVFLYPCLSYRGSPFGEASRPATIPNSSARSDPFFTNIDPAPHFWCCGAVFSFANTTRSQSSHTIRRAIGG